ncbi:hypothetical protein IAR50_006409 [Cryptococcus sp. DSM 104548]
MSEDSVPFKTLLLTVFDSIVEVFLLCAAGYILARAGVTDKATQRKLNVINVSLFTPALLFSKVAYSLTPAKLKELWIIPLGFVIITGISAGVAWILAKTFKLSKSQTAFAICASMFQNSNSLPIALIQSLVVEVPGLKWDDDDNKNQMLGRALTYLVLYSTLGMMLRWSWGVKLLSGADEEANVEPDESGITGNGSLVQSPGQMGNSGIERDPFFSPHNGETPTRHGSTIGVTPTTVRQPTSPTLPFTAPGSAHSMQPTPARRPSATGTERSFSALSATKRLRAPSRTESGREFLGLPEAPRERAIDWIDEVDSSDEEDEEWGSDSAPSLRLRRLPPRTAFQKFTAKGKVIAGKVNAFMTVPMYAALLSIFIAMIQPLQAKMAEFKPLEQAIKGAGQCSIPVTLVVLGAFFYTPPAPPAMPISLPPDEQDPPAKRDNFFQRKFRAIAGYSPMGGNGAAELKKKAYPGENRAVFVAVVSRMIITPLVMMPFLALMAKYDLFEAAEDPVFVLSAVLLVSSPPALTLAQITQAASGDAFERLISKTISWSYAVLTPPLTLVYVVIGLIFGRM